MRLNCVYGYLADNEWKYVGKTKYKSTRFGKHRRESEFCKDYPHGEFIILEDNLSDEDIKKSEEKWIAKCDTYRNGYNKTPRYAPGGGPKTILWDHVDEVIQMKREKMTYNQIASRFNCCEHLVLILIRKFAPELISTNSYKILLSNHGEEIAQMRRDGFLIREIASHFETSKSRISRILSELDVKPKYIEDTDIIIDRRKNGEHPDQIALDYNTTSRTIARLIAKHAPEADKIKYNIHRRSNLPKCKEEIIKMRKDGFPCYQIAKKFNCSITTVVNYTKHLKLKPADRRRKWNSVITEDQQRFF